MANRYVVERPPTEITDEGWYWLRAKDVTETIIYKPDIYTSKGIYPEPANEWGLPTQAGYEA